VQVSAQRLEAPPDLEEPAKAVLSIPAELTKNYFLMAAGRNLPDMAGQKM
jgi:hypothetical protein